MQTVKRPTIQPRTPRKILTFQQLFDDFKSQFDCFIAAQPFISRGSVLGEQFICLKRSKDALQLKLPNRTGLREALNEFEDNWMEFVNVESRLEQDGIVPHLNAITQAFVQAHTQISTLIAHIGSSAFRTDPSISALKKLMTFFEDFRLNLVELYKRAPDERFDIFDLEVFKQDMKSLHRQTIDTFCKSINHACLPSAEVKNARVVLSASIATITDLVIGTASFDNDIEYFKSSIIGFNDALKELFKRNGIDFGVTLLFHNTDAGTPRK